MAVTLLSGSAFALLRDAFFAARRSVKLNPVLAFVAEMDSDCWTVSELGFLNFEISSRCS